MGQTMIVSVATLSGLDTGSSEDAIDRLPVIVLVVGLRGLVWAV